jgi:hypothetical protein
MKTLLPVILLATSLLCACADQSTKPEAKAAGGDGAPVAAAVNAQCPVSGKPVDPAIPAASLQGHAIGFCCEQCPETFAAMSDADKVAALAKHGCTLPE